MNPKVDVFLANVKNWQAELEKLRMILLDCSLTEELKWKQPCYTFNNANVAIISEFKEHCVLSFFKGALLNDSHAILLKSGENTQAGRIIKFTTIEEIVELEPVLKSYIHEAILIEKAGLKVDFSANKELVFSKELQNKLGESPAFKTAFEALTPGRQRGYNLFFSAPKQSKTRIVRIEKYVQQILDGKGINDCTCGLSKKQPSCDGSHKYIE